MRGALSGLLAAAAVLASNAKEFKFRAPARGEKYNTTRTWDADAPITVHIMPHTHDDVGWLKTVDQYATGANMSIQFAWVNTLITTMTEQLALNPDRTAIYVEQAFYQRWWNQATDVQRNQWRDFIANGQAEFVGGGWCMPDEANEHVWAGVDQFTLGNALLMGQFGPDAMPTTLAQWDPFGHTAGYSYLMGSEAGMDGMYYGRQDYQERETRKNESSLEYVWRPSDSLGEEVQLFAHTDFGGNYQPFPGLNFDINQHDGQIQDSNDPTMQLPNNVQYYVDLFVQEALKEANSSRTGQILFTAGSDFQYTDAISWYRNLDRLIHYVNQQTEKTGVRAQYNTLRGYTKASNAAALKRGVKFSVDTYDLMNYRDSEHAVWSGYFVSRPSHKGYIRDGQRMLRAASILNAASEGGKGYMDFQFARQAQGVVQHHDSVTGTAKQHVTFDYFKRISTGMSQTARAVSSGLAQALNDPALENKLTQCFRANESVCAVTQASSTGFDVAVYSWLGRSTSSVVRLPIEGTQATVTQIGGSTVPSQVEANMAVPFVKDGASHSVVFVATTPGVGISTYRVTTSSSSSSSADFEHKLAAKSKASKLRGAASAGAASSITNGVITVHFDAGSGRISGISNDKQGVNMTAAQDYVWYNSSAGNGGNHPWGNGGSQPSGAYIFRPNRSEPFAVGSVPADGLKGDLRDTLLPADDLERMGQLPPVELSIEGSGELGAQDLVVSATQKFSDWLTQTVRLYDGFDYVELETTVGPIPFEDGLGKEIVSRWKTDVTNGDDCVLKADSNGRDFMTRRLNYRPTYKLNITEPVAENYYPLTAAAYIQDGGNGRVFGILSDRAQSVASLDQGEIETMVHRRVLQDDRRGVGEPLNETTGVQYHPSFERLGHGLVIRYVQRITVGKGAEGVRSVRSGMDDMFARPVVSVAAPGSIQGKGGSVLKENLSLPENIFIANCDYFNDSSPLLGDEYHEETGWPLRASSGNGDGVWLVRLAHQYGKGEHPTLSQNVTIDLVADLLGDGAGRGVVQVEETTMFAHRRMQDVNRLQWPTEDGSVNPPRTVADPISYKAPAGGKASPGDVKITLWPMKIRTFLVRVQA